MKDFLRLKKGLFQTHQNTRGAVGQGSVGDVGMAGDPADVSGAPVHVVIAMIKNILEGQRCVEQIPGNSVENTLYRTRGGTRERAGDWFAQRQAEIEGAETATTRRR